MEPTNEGKTTEDLNSGPNSTPTENMNSGSNNIVSDPNNDGAGPPKVSVTPVTNSGSLVRSDLNPQVEVASPLGGPLSGASAPADYASGSIVTDPQEASAPIEYASGSIVPADYASGSIVPDPQGASAPIEYASGSIVTDPQGASAPIEYASGSIVTDPQGASAPIEYASGSIVTDPQGASAPIVPADYTSGSIVTYPQGASAPIEYASGSIVPADYTSGSIVTGGLNSAPGGLNSAPNLGKKARVVEVVSDNQRPALDTEITIGNQKPNPPKNVNQPTYTQNGMNARAAKINMQNKMRAVVPLDVNTGMPTQQMEVPTEQMGMPTEQMGMPTVQMGMPTVQMGVPQGQLGPSRMRHQINISPISNIDMFDLLKRMTTIESQLLSQIMSYHQTINSLQARIEVIENRPPVYSGGTRVKKARKTIKKRL